MRSDGLAGTNVEPTDLFVFARGDENIEVGGPDDVLDGGFVHSGAYFVALGGLRMTILEIEGGAVGGGAVAVRGARAVKFVYHELLFEAAGGEELGAGLRREGHGAHNVSMLDCVQTFARVRVPDLTVGERRISAEFEG